MYASPTSHRPQLWRRVQRTLIVLSGLSLLLAPGQALVSRLPAAAATLSVCQSDCAYTIIQAAIDKAAPGDTVSVAAGTYNEHVTIDKGLTLAGAGAGQTIVDAGRTGTAITITAGVSAAISGLTAQNGVGSNSASPLDGGGIVNAGTLTLADSVVSDSGGSGGTAILNSGALTLRRSTVRDNGGSGGGIVSSGTLALFASTVSHNSSGCTGGISNSGTATLTDSVVSGNSGAYCTGGIANSGTLALVRSTVARNGASRGVGGIGNSGTATLTDSTVSGNSANGSFGVGGIFNQGALIVTASTVAGNTGTNVGGIDNAYPYNGGSSIPVALADTVVASNTSNTTSSTIGVNYPDCNGSFASSGYNLIGVAVSCSGLANGANGDWVGSPDRPLDPRLEPLQDNGGPTPTQALLPGSPAIDAIPGDRCAVATDQRGFARPYPASGRCDIGAFELSATGDTAGGTATAGRTATATAGQTATAAAQQTADAAAQQTEIALQNASRQTVIAARQQTYVAGQTATAAAGQTTATATSTPSAGATGIPKVTGTPATPPSTPIAGGALGGGGVAVAGSVTGNSGPYFGEEDVSITPTAPLTALRIVVTVRKTPGVSYAGQYNTFWYGELTSSHSETADAIIYTFELAPRQTVPPGGGLRVAAQFNGDGTPHDVGGDSYTVSYTSGGVTTTTAGTFGGPSTGPTPAATASPAASPTAAATGGAGFLAASGRVAPNGGPYYSEEDVVVTNTAPLTSLAITVTVAGQTNPRGPFGPVGYLGQYDTFPAGALGQGHRVNTYNLGPGTPDLVRSIDYTYTLNAGQIRQPGAGQLAAAQFSFGGVHYDSADTYTVVATGADGAVATISGHF